MSAYDIVMDGWMDIKPEPEVYRMAAEYLDEGYGPFACWAIASAVSRFYRTRFLEANLERVIYLYQAQYAAVFANLRGKVEYVGTSRGRPGFSGSSPRDSEGRALSQRYCKDKSLHPWWDMPRTAERQQMRIMSLLLMADIIESGGFN